MQEIVLVRHGETLGQSSIRLYGATDVELSPEGEAQVAAAGRALAGARFDRVFTSPLSRARRSTEIVLANIPHPPVGVEVVEGFREVDFGRWEGWTWAEVEARDPEGFASFHREGPNFSYPTGESRRGFVDRVQAAVGPSLEAALGEGAQRLLVVVHKGVIKAIAARLLGVPVHELASEWDPALGSVHRLRAAPMHTRADSRRHWERAS
ncbi:histidine phosphatase family protein [Pseudenhygromyxa sp. WMMC2535]|uniref:histidine phosphatase family protein n=1 Tax=Pseudenhygromyxa sp. WMMC2535 TaxID=2712867 RepID=UPI0015539045|nr:histidine phosphatase family protein [Pseudenhygromyxa sp. WMMC2535]